MFLVFKHLKSMKSSIVSAVNHNLNQAIRLLNTIENNSYTNTSIGPYHSSIGSHLRHTLDFFQCIIDGLDANEINLTQRKRDESIANDKNIAIEKIQELQETFISFLDINTNYLIHVTDDLGQGEVTVSYTLESILAFAHSHAIHHFATIGYLLHQLDIKHTIAGFGYNPTTPIEQRKGI